MGLVLAPGEVTSGVWVLSQGLAAELLVLSAVTTACCLYSVCSSCFSFQGLMPPEGPEELQKQRIRVGNWVLESYHLMLPVLR